jgi:Ser/Thr protein kinase RdoA (MazF antagonist)
MLTPSELEAITAWVQDAYGTSEASIAGAATRTTGVALRVRLSDRTLWLRAGGVVARGLPMVELEGLVASGLAAQGVPLAIPIRRVDGRFAGALRLRGLELPAIGYAELRGVLVEKPRVEQAEAFAVALRKLHGAAVVDGALALPKVEPLAGIDARLSGVARWLTGEQLRELTELVSGARAQVLEANLPACICHGDARYANVFFDDAGATLFDLEALGVGPACHDLACLWRRCVAENDFDVACPDEWRWFRLAYDANGAGGPVCWSLLPALACLRAFWTMALPIQPNSDWGEPYRSSPDYWAAHIAQVKWFGNASQTENGSV